MKHSELENMIKEWKDKLLWAQIVEIEQVSRYISYSIMYRKSKRELESSRKSKTG